MCWRHLAICFTVLMDVSLRFCRTFPWLQVVHLHTSSSSPTCTLELPLQGAGPHLAGILLTHIHPKLNSALVGQCLVSKRMGGGQNLGAVPRAYSHDPNLHRAGLEG